MRFSKEKKGYSKDNSENSEDKAHNKLDNKDTEDILIELFFDVTLFISTSALIFHEFSIMSSIDNDS